MIKTFENYTPYASNELWLVPTDERFYKIIKESKILEKFFDSFKNLFGDNVKQSIIACFDDNFSDTDDYIDFDYVFIGYSYDRNEWLEFNQNSINWMKENNYNNNGPLGISQEEYDTAMLKIEASKYNL